MSLMNKLTQLQNSPQGKKITDKFQKVANDPKTRAKIENAKRKLDEKRGRGGAGGTGTGSGPKPAA